MTDSLTPTVEQKKSRRGLLALVGAGGAAAVAALLGRSNGAHAAASYPWSDANTDPVGEFTNTSTGDGVRGESVQGSGWGGAGVHGLGSSGRGVYGESIDFIGVHGASANSDAVRGDAAGSGTGVYGSSSSGYGVHGESNTYTGVYGESNTYPGVYGKSSNSAGVEGYSPSSNGVRGVSGVNAPGVLGEGKPGVLGWCNRDNGSGVKGEGAAPGSIGLYGVNAPGRRALRTKGRVQMDTARKVTLSNRSNLVTLPPGVEAGAFAIVLAMVQGASGNGAFVRRAWRVDDKHIRITFDKKPANPTAVGYWVVQTG